MYYYREAQGFWPVYPSEDPNAFYPRPYLTFSVAKFNNVQLSRLPALVPGKFAVAVILSYENLSPEKIEFKFLTPEEFKQCNLVLTGLITNSTGEVRCCLSSFQFCD